MNIAGRLDRNHKSITSSRLYFKTPSNRLSSATEPALGVRNARPRSRDVLAYGVCFAQRSGTISRSPPLSDTVGPSHTTSTTHSLAFDVATLGVLAAAGADDSLWQSLRSSVCCHVERVRHRPAFISRILLQIQMLLLCRLASAVSHARLADVLKNGVELRLPYMLADVSSFLLFCAAVPASQRPGLFQPCLL